MTEVPLEFTLQSMLPTSGAIEDSAIGWVLYDTEFVVRDLNPAAGAVFGVTRESFLGRRISELPWTAYSESGEEFTDELRPSMRSLRTAQSVVNQTIRLIVNGGSSRWISLSTHPVSVDGAVCAVATSYVDVTESVVARDQLNVMIDIGRLSREAESRDAYLTGLCQSLVSVGDFALAVITSGTANQTQVIASAGLDVEFRHVLAQEDPRLMHGEGFAGKALRTGTTQVLNDLLSDPLAAAWRGHMEPLHLRSAIAVPFPADGGDLLLSIYSKIDHHFNETVVAAITEMIAEILQGLAHVETTEQLRRTFSGTLAALAAASEVRDPYTAGHQRNVGRLGAAIARQLGLDESLTTLIEQAGAVHDIGKISIPAEILTRPGRLSDIEFEMMKYHTVVGNDILAKAELPWPIPEVALQHHERLNGSGYPQGLYGDDIIVPARIIAVADVVEAMAHHRPYRAAPGLERALDEIAKGAGTIYDAAVATACRDVFDEGFQFLEADPLQSTMGVGTHAP